MRLFYFYFILISSICMDRFNAYHGVYDNTMYNDFNDNAMVFDENAYRTEVHAVRNASTGYPDPINGRLLDNWDPASGVRAHEVGHYYQGDILHIPDISGRSAIFSQRYLWLNKVVYYKISPTFSASDRNRIMQAINQYNTRTCMRLVQAGPKTRNYVDISNSKAGCFSEIGMRGGAQMLNLQTPGCLYDVGTPVHELLHAVGFFHEHARTDRDKYVTILKQNIFPGNESQFDIARNSFHHNVPYDYGSVMHYTELAFSKNNQPTIVAKQKGVKLGNDVGLTPLDIRKIKALYKC